jgi:myosin III
VIDLVRGLQQADKKMNEEHIAFVLKETVKALTYLHEQNIIHRDVRSSNILLTKDGDVKLADFGLSCRLPTNRGKKHTIVGSPSWMSPEVVSGGDASYGNRADVWSLGITAIELGDGVAPFQEMHPTRALFQIVRNPPPTLQRPSNWSNDYNDFISE